MEQNVKIDTNNSALLKLKHQLEAVQVQNEQFSSAQARGMVKVDSLESNQTKILGLLSSLKESNDIIQERLNAFEKLDGAAGDNNTSSVTFKFHDGATKNSGSKVGSLDIYLTNISFYILGA